MYINIYNTYKEIIIDYKNYVNIMIVYNIKRYYFNPFNTQYLILWKLDNAYSKMFQMENNNSTISISKNSIYKHIYLKNILCVKYNTLYIYFIYNKYYTYFIGKKDYCFYKKTSNSKKLFNSRDHYRLHAFI